MVSLRAMTEEEFRSFLSKDIEDYAAEKVKAGNWTAEEALRRSQQDHDGLLPRGLASPHQHLYTIELDGEPVGRLWLSTDPKLGGGVGFIYDVFVAEAFRRRGVAKQALRLLETEALQFGLKSLALHVFGFNTAARSMYEDLGYTVTNINMAKALSAE
ncbi:MAG TPA: GNAT family N-acetyltransferase [Anaerolineales bacterium]|nr:GNAT family N-acetyltransferase [Anaerolineales bacterium]